MTRNSDPSVNGKIVRVWKCGELPMPDWVPRHMASGIEANGTFEIDAEPGHVRAHPGQIVIERCGTVWVRPVDEADEFIESLEIHERPVISSIGPGKARQFGQAGRSSRRKPGRIAGKKGGRPIYLPPSGSPPSIEWIHRNMLSVDAAYQRSTDNETSRKLIASIAARFDWRLCAPLVVSRRADDRLVIIDGQHRWMAVCRRDDIPHLPCCVFKYANIEEEARMFIVANRARKPISRLDDYYAALAAADEDAQEIRELVDSAGLRIARSTAATAWKPGEIAFTSAIAAAIRRHGAAIVSAALTNLADAFPNQKLAHGGAIFGGIVRMMSQPEAGFDPDRLMTALQTRTADQWGAFAAGVHGGDRRVTALHEAIRDSYRNLPWA